MLFREKIIFSDESKFNIFNSNGWNYVWKRSNTELDIQNIRSIIKHNDMGLMAANGISIPAWYIMGGI